MPPLRTTPRFRPRPAALLGALLAALAAGCGSGQRVTNVPHTAPATNLGGKGNPDRGALPPPDPARIVFEPKSRTLKFPELGQGRWMIQLPGDKAGKPVGAEHNLPAEVDPNTTLVYYSQPGGKHSTPVSLKQILDSHQN